MFFPANSINNGYGVVVMRKVMNAEPEYSDDTAGEKVNWMS